MPLQRVTSLRCRARANAAAAAAGADADEYIAQGCRGVEPAPLLHTVSTSHLQCVRFKLALIVFKCLHGLAPSYLTDDCVLVSSVAGRRPLRSADTEPCTFHGFVLPSAPGTLQWLAHVYGTVCRLNCEC